MATTAHLLRLPPELMLRIAHHLNTIDLGGFRLTCKQVETNLFDSFAREFFTKRQFMIEKVSLDALVGIANHKTLAPFLNEVIIGLDTLCDYEPAVHHEQTNNRRDIFLATGRACSLLVEAFKKLPNLRKVGLRDYDGKGRFRDGEDAYWKSYGWSSSGHGFSRPRKQFTKPDSSLSFLLYTLSEASVHPTNLEVFLRRKRMPDHAFDLSNLAGADLTAVLSGLRTLLLSLENVPPGLSDYTAHHHLKHFLQHTSLLEYLRLNFANDNNFFRDINGSNDFMDWLGTPFGAPGLTVPPIALDNLTQLDLGMLSLKSNSLLRVVSKFTKLERLYLWKVALWCRTDEVPDSTGGVWSQFLPKLGRAFQAPENVSGVMIGFPVEERGTQQPSTIKFAKKVNVDRNGQKQYEDAVSQATYRQRVGSNVQDWLEELGNKVLVERMDVGEDSDDSGLTVDSDDDEEDNHDSEDESDENDDVVVLN